MSTAIRSAVIELGIRQLQAKLVPPDVSAFIETQKSLESMGTTAERSASIATQQWGAFSEKVLQLQQQLLATDDTFEKILADGVAWEETLPGIAAGTNEAAAAGERHAASLGLQLRSVGYLGRGALEASRGVLFLAAADEKHRAEMLQKLFVIQAGTDLARGLSWAYRGIAQSLKEVTAAELAWKLLNPEFAVVAAALVAVASAAGAVYNVFTANRQAIENLTDDYKHNAEQSEKMVELWQMQAAGAHTSAEKLDALRAAGAELYTQQVKLMALGQEAESRGYHDQAAELEEKAFEIAKKSLSVEQQKAEAKRYDIELQDKLVDRKLEELRIDKEKDDRTRGLGASLFELGPEGRAKRAMALAGTNNAANLAGTNEHQLDFLAHDPDARIRELARTEEARRAVQMGLNAPGILAPVDPAVRRDNQTRELENQHHQNTAKIDTAQADFAKLHATLVTALRKLQEEIDMIRNAARAKAAGRGYPTSSAGGI
jgi:hypothetical protein